MDKPTIAAFDMDGTLTTSDTMFEFMKFTHGKSRFLINFAVLLPILILYKLGIIRNDKAKSTVLSLFYKGKSYEWFRSMGEKFADKIDTIVNSETYAILQKYRLAGSKVVIVSASVADWIEPWANRNGINTVIATRLEFDSNGKITGKLSTPNCYGQEKVNMLLSTYPLRNTYSLHAYGDSNGDKELLAFADESHLIKT